MERTTTTFRRFVGMAVLVTAVIAGSAATAQEQREEVRDLAESSQNLLDEDVQTLSGQEKLKRAQKKIAQAKQQLGRTGELLKRTRSQEKDIAKVNCVNDKQAAIKGFLKVAEQSYVKLKQAVSDGDQEAANHHYTLIAVSHQKIQKLNEEARMCAGEVQRYAEGTAVEVDVDEELADEPRYLSDEPTAGTLALPELTPFQ